MGNVQGIADVDLLDGCCGRRDALAFQPPNAEHVTYRFDCATHSEFKFWNGVSAPVSELGFPLECHTRERAVPKWKTLWEYSPDAAQSKIVLSGRFLVQCPEALLMPRADPQSACVFKFCTRGKPIFESVKTRTFTHTAHVVTSGIFFVLNIQTSPDGACLNPRIMLVLEGGDEITLVEDRLGPLWPSPPDRYYVDFAVLDDGGRDVQMDLIFRAITDSGSGPPPKRQPNGFRTLRTCLQEYTTFNGQVTPAHIALGSSDMLAAFPSSSVHVQNIVLSEEPIQNARPLSPRAACQGSGRNGPGPPHWHGPGPPALAMTTLPHPPSPTGSAASLLAAMTAKLEGKALFKGISVIAEALGNKFAEQKTDMTKDFWHHVKYTAEPDLHRRRRHLTGLGDNPSMNQRGEFWLSREAVDKSSVYFRCFTTLQQALTMCVIFRFTCPTDYLSLIESQAASVLKDLHIPTNGVVMGIEHDPRHKGLVRMFVEHRNEILDDIVVCECRLEDLKRVGCCQEVYDSGSHISYRVVLFFPDGTQLQACLQLDAKRLEDSNQDKSNPYEVVGDPSSRFPILPSQSLQLLSPANRIFVYTSTAYELRESGGFDSDHSRLPGALGRSIGSTCLSPSPDGAGEAEDWQSAFGSLVSDGETADPSSSVVQRAQRFFSGDTEDQDPGRVEWQRPLVDSMLVMGDVEEAPFNCSRLAR